MTSFTRILSSAKVTTYDTTASAVHDRPTKNSLEKREHKAVREIAKEGSKTEWRRDAQLAANFEEHHPSLWEILTDPIAYEKSKSVPEMSISNACIFFDKVRPVQATLCSV